MDDERLKRFGNYIKVLRESQGLSQEELAKKSGFAGRAAISAIEKGKTNISIDRLPDIAYALQITPGRLLDVLIERNDRTDDFTEGLSAENLLRLKSYADYLRSIQNNVEESKHD